MNTIGTFWQLIFERRCHAVVMLCDLSQDKKVHYDVNKNLTTYSLALTTNCYILGSLCEILD